jgi:hypothetical protein
MTPMAAMSNFRKTNLFFLYENEVGMKRPKSREIAKFSLALEAKQE